MAIVKIIKRECPFVTIDKTGIDDPNLSWGATGLLTYLIGRPSNWKINVTHLSSVKTCRETATKSVLKELREANYCHYFVVRKNGKISETFYLVFEVPTNYEDVLEDYIDLKEGETILYQPVKTKEKNSKNLEEKLPQVENQLLEKNIENKEVLPQVDFPLVENLRVENQGLIIIDNNNNRMNKIKNHDHDLNNDLKEIKKLFNEVGIDFSEKHKEKIKELLKKNSKEYLLSHFQKQYQILKEKENVKSIPAIMSNHLFKGTCEVDSNFIIQKKEENKSYNSEILLELENVMDYVEKNESKIIEEKIKKEDKKVLEIANILEKTKTLPETLKEKVIKKAEEKYLKENKEQDLDSLNFIKKGSQDIFYKIISSQLKEILIEEKII
ncbi:replication protein [Fusobacterium gastrosuis]|uniref:replication protein n=1 Tax=Fusobacterium gastrosuis TaxID=1755100 RepID=UPI0029753723|nr:replication protein [Fusobacteriaceae bacterium]MDY5714078.1 replication protein [Fusobacterium gastrosuis]